MYQRGRYNTLDTGELEFEEHHLIQIPIDPGCRVAFVLPQSRLEPKTFERMIRWLEFLRVQLRDDSERSAAEGAAGEGE